MMKIFQIKKDKLIHSKSNRYFVPREIPPTCAPDGYYAKLQTNPENFSELFCANKDGNPIETFVGDRSRISGRKMNCECALTREYLSVGSVKPSCCKNGNFKNPQCISGLCFCVDQVPISLIAKTILP